MDEASPKFAHNAGLHMRVDTGAGVYGNHLEGRTLQHNASDTELKRRDQDLRTLPYF